MADPETSIFLVFKKMTEHHISVVARSQSVAPWFRALARADLDRGQGRVHAGCFQAWPVVLLLVVGSRAFGAPLLFFSSFLFREEETEAEDLELWAISRADGRGTIPGSCQESLDPCRAHFVVYCPWRSPPSGTRDFHGLYIYTMADEASTLSVQNREAGV